MTEQTFRRGDRVMVRLRDRKSRGRVICHNRRNKYGLCLVVLVETERDTEIIETFTINGHRIREGDSSLERYWDEPKES
jgi:hypothetical protein